MFNQPESINPNHETIPIRQIIFQNGDCKISITNNNQDKISQYFDYEFNNHQGQLQSLDVYNTKNLQLPQYDKGQEYIQNEQKKQFDLYTQPEIRNSSNIKQEKNWFRVILQQIKNNIEKNNLQSNIKIQGNKGRPIGKGSTPCNCKDKCRKKNWGVYLFY